MNMPPGGTGQPPGGWPGQSPQGAPPAAHNPNPQDGKNRPGGTALGNPPPVAPTMMDQSAYGAPAQAPANPNTEAWPLTSAPGQPYPPGGSAPSAGAAMGQPYAHYAAGTPPYGPAAQPVIAIPPTPGLPQIDPRALPGHYGYGVPPVPDRAQQYSSKTQGVGAGLIAILIAIGVLFVGGVVVGLVMLLRSRAAAPTPTPAFGSASSISVQIPADSSSSTLPSNTAPVHPYTVWPKHPHPKASASGAGPAGAHASGGSPGVTPSDKDKSDKDKNAGSGGSSSDGRSIPRIHPKP